MSAAVVFRVRWEDSRAKLANMIASVTGMRSGEIIALRFQDLGSDCLYVQAAWNREDGLKPPKNNETRTVELPFPDLVHELFEQAKQNPWGVTPDSYVFWSEFRKDRPIQPYMFVDGLRSALVQIGYTEADAKKYLFHGWRHFYTSYMINRLDKKLLKSQTGHRFTDFIIRFITAWGWTGYTIDPSTAPPNINRPKAGGGWFFVLTTAGKNLPPARVD